MSHAYAHVPPIPKRPNNWGGNGRTGFRFTPSRAFAHMYMGVIKLGPSIVTTVMQGAGRNGLKKALRADLPRKLWAVMRRA